MYCTRKITDDLIWVGADDRRLALFEGLYAVPKGISYNSYLLLDEKTVLFDTVDLAVEKIFLENISHSLQGRALDYIVVSHMEPDHSATLANLLLHYPDAVVICNKITQNMIYQFFGNELSIKVHLVGEGDVFETGHHRLTFFMAPMVHWPEVMVTYDALDKILFSADAFGTFGALNGALFADEVDFFGEYLSEARRYYTNIVGKFGVQVQALLKKAASVSIKMICPLHGFVWRENIASYLEKYRLWSSYRPETAGVMIAYASVYGNTENAANILSCRLREKGIKTVMFDVSVTGADEIIAAAFQYSHFVFASITYNGSVFLPMRELLQKLSDLNIQNRSIAFIENGTWAAACGKKMKELLSEQKNMTVLEPVLTIKSTLQPTQADDIKRLVDVITASVSAKNL